MTLTLDNFVVALSSSGLLPSIEVEATLERLSAQDLEDAQALAQALVAQGRLTSYQARELLSGRTTGLVLGNYTIVDRLGAGGMGVVYKAQHRRMKRVVALKTLPPQVVDSPEALSRFHREVEAAARLTHTNIVTAYDADEADGVHFLVMQYVPGSDLAHHVRRVGRLSIRKTVDCILQAARGLHYAHQKGVVHRDIKPGNLLLDPEGVVRVLDMGLARIEQDVNEPSATVFETANELTGTGRVLGTVDYMSPEQATDAKHVDRRTDIYSLGCTLYFLLTGRSPTPEGSLKAKLDWHESGPIPSLQNVRPEVPPELEIIFRRMMARQPDERYPSMGELIPDLEACLAALADVPEPTIDFAQKSPLPAAAQTAKPTASLVVPELVTEDPWHPPLVSPTPMPVYQLPRSGDTHPAHVPPDVTVVEQVVQRSTQGIRRARRKEKQAWLVAGGVIGAGLLGGMLIWLAGYFTGGPEQHADWNEEVRQMIERDVMLRDGINGPHGRRLYGEVMAVLAGSQGGDWFIGADLTRDNTARYLRFRGSRYEVKSLTPEDARSRGVQPDRLHSVDIAPSDRSQPLATLERLELRLVTGADGTQNLQGRVQCTRTSPDLVKDGVVQVLRRDSVLGKLSLVATQALPGEQVELGVLNINAPVSTATLSPGDDLQICLRGFLFDPQPGLYRISNETGCRLAQ